MDVLKYDLYDVVELKKAHPCSTHNKLFQIVRLGADIKVTCLGCGNVIMMTRFDFNKKIKKVIDHHPGPIEKKGQ